MTGGIWVNAVTLEPMGAKNKKKANVIYDVLILLVLGTYRL